jgi:iron complex transport system permease protein
LTRRPIAFVSLLLAVVVALALGAGTESISLERAFREEGLDRTILRDVRLPRVALAALAGAGLSAVGAAFQALLRNPLAEPYILGVSGGAALGATTAIALGLGAATMLGAALLPIASLVGGLVATSLVYSIARSARSGASSTTILLAGVMVNSIAAALITFQKALVPPSRAQQLLRWLVGFVDLPHLPSLAAGTLYVGAGCAVLLHDAAQLNVLALGDETAATLGVDVPKLERRIFFAASCIVGAIVSMTGLIGFVGLVVPHAVRRLIGYDQRRVMPVSMLAGAAMVVGCDLLARLTFRALGTEPPVGAVTAIIGGPTFLILLRKNSL